MADDKISSDKAKELFEEKLRTDATRQHLLSIVDGYANTVPFMKKVQEYAAEEMDKRIFRSWKYWATVVLTAIITALVAGVIAIYIFHQAAK